MKRTGFLTFLQFICGILAVYGFYITASDYIELKNHPEWSTPAYYSLIEMGIFVLIAVLFASVVQWLKKR